MSQNRLAGTLRLSGIPLKVATIRMLQKSLILNGDSLQAMSFENCGITDAGFRVIPTQRFNPNP